MSVEDVVQSTIINAPIERVWQALSNHSEFGSWFGCNITAPFVAGQTARGQITNPPGYSHLTIEFVVQQIEAPKLFSFTWHPYAVDQKVDYSSETPTLNSFRLEQTTPTTTKVEVVESGFSAIPEHRQAEARKMNDKGWEIQMGNIKRHVETSQSA